MTQTEGLPTGPEVKLETPLQAQMRAVEAKFNKALGDTPTVAAQQAELRNATTGGLNLDALDRKGLMTAQELAETEARVKAEVARATSLAKPGGIDETAAAAYGQRQEEKRAAEAAARTAAVAAVASADSPEATLAALAQAGLVAETATVAPAGSTLDATSAAVVAMPAPAESAPPAPTYHMEKRMVSKEVEVPATVEDLFKMSREDLAKLALVISGNSAELPVVATETTVTRHNLESNVYNQLQQLLKRLTGSTQNIGLFAGEMSKKLMAKFDDLKQERGSDAQFKKDDVATIIKDVASQQGPYELSWNTIIFQTAEGISNVFNARLKEIDHENALKDDAIKQSFTAMVRQVINDNPSLANFGEQWAQNGAKLVANVLDDLSSGDFKLQTKESFVTQVADIAASKERASMQINSAKRIFGKIASDVLTRMVGQLPPKRETQEFEEEFEVPDTLAATVIEPVPATPASAVIAPMIDDAELAALAAVAAATVVDPGETGSATAPVETEVVGTPESKAEAFKKKLEGFKKKYKDLVENKDDEAMKAFNKLVPEDFMLGTIGSVNGRIDLAAGADGYEGVAPKNDADQPYTDSEIRLQVTKVLYDGLKGQEPFKTKLKESSRAVAEQFNAFLDKIFGEASRTNDRETGIFEIQSGEILRPDGKDKELYGRLADALKIPKAESKKSGFKGIKLAVLGALKGLFRYGTTPEVVAPTPEATSVAEPAVEVAKTPAELDAEFKQGLNEPWFRIQVKERYFDRAKRQVQAEERARLEPDRDRAEQILKDAEHSDDHALKELSRLILLIDDLSTVTPEQITQMRELSAKLGIANNEKNQIELEKKNKTTIEAAVQNATVAAETAIAAVDASTLPEGQKTKIKQVLKNFLVAFAAGGSTFTLTSLGGDGGAIVGLVASLGSGALAAVPEYTFGYGTTFAEKKGHEWKQTKRLKWFGSGIAKVASSMQSWRNKGYFASAAIGGIIGTMAGAISASYLAEQPSEAPKADGDGGNSSSNDNDGFSSRQFGGDQGDGAGTGTNAPDGASATPSSESQGGQPTPSGVSAEAMPDRTGKPGFGDQDGTFRGDQNDGAVAHPGQTGPEERTRYGGDQGNGAVAHPNNRLDSTVVTPNDHLADAGHIDQSIPDTSAPATSNTTLEATPTVVNLTTANTEPTLWNEVQADLQNIPGIDAQSSMNGVDLARPLQEGADPNLLTVNAIKNADRILTEAYGGADHSIWDNFSSFETSHIAMPSNMDSLAQFAGSPITVSQEVMASIVRHLPDALSKNPSGNIPADVRSVLNHLAYGDWMQLPVKLDAQSTQQFEQALKWLSVN